MELLVLITKDILVVLDLFDLGLGGLISAVWRWMINFRLSMSFHTSRVVTRPEFSDGSNASPLRVLLRDAESGSVGIRGWKSSTEKLALLSWVVVGGASGPPRVGPPSVRR